MAGLCIGEADVVVIKDGEPMVIPFQAITPKSSIVKDKESFLLGYECGRQFERTFYKNEKQQELFEQ